MTQGVPKRKSSSTSYTTIARDISDKIGNRKYQDRFATNDINGIEASISSNEENHVSLDPSSNATWFVKEFVHGKLTCLTLGDMYAANTLDANIRPPALIYDTLTRIESVSVWSDHACPINAWIVQ